MTAKDTRYRKEPGNAVFDGVTVRAVPVSAVR